MRLPSSGARERFAARCLPVVVVMQAAQHGERDDLSARRRLISSLRLAGYALLDALVGSGVIEVRLILLHHPLQMSLAQDEEEVQALSPHTAQKALTVSIRLRRLIGCAQHLNSSPGSYRRERDAVLVVIVPNEEPAVLRQMESLLAVAGPPSHRWDSWSQSAPGVASPAQS